MPVAVITLGEGTLAGLAPRLAAAGWTVRERPLLTFHPPLDWTPVDAAIATLDRFAAAAFTSPRAAQSFVARMSDAATRGVALPRVLPEAWAVGAGSAASLGGVWHTVRGPLEAGGGALLARAMLAAGVGSPVLFPSGEQHREDLPAALRAAGREVVEVTCYRARLAAPAEVAAALAGADVAVIGSPRVASLVAAAPAPRPRLVAIGPTTAHAAADAGWVPDAVATAATSEALLAAIQRIHPSPPERA